MAQKILQLCFLFIGFSVVGQQDLSLSQAIEIGLKNNFQIQISEVNTQIAENNNSWALAGKYPKVDFSLGIPYSFTDQNNPTSFLPELTANSVGVTPGINAQWTFFDGYKVKFTKQQLEKLEDLAKGQAKVAVENSVQAVILAYQNALIQKEQLTVLEEVLKLSRDRIGYEEVKVEFGQSGKFDLLQTQDAYLNDSTSFLIQKNTNDIALRNLNLAMGLDDLSRSFNLTEKLNYDAQDYKLSTLKKMMFVTNQSLNNLLINRDLSSIETKIKESAKYPKIALNLGANYDLNNSTIDAITSRQESLDTSTTVKTFNSFASISASYSIFDGGIRKRQIESAKLAEMVAQLQIDELKRDLTAQLENTLATYDNQRQLVLLTQNLIENAQENLRIADERRKGGLITSFDYRTIQLNYVNASQARLNAIFNLKTTETELIKLIGGYIR